MPVPDDEPQYWLRNLAGTVKGALQLDSNDNPAIVNENGDEASLESDGTWDVPKVSTIDLSITQGHGLLGLPNHHTQYSDSLTDEELTRFTLAAGDVLNVWRLECALKGGGTNSNVSLDVYDATNATVLASVSGGSRAEGGTSPIGTSGAGATILVRLSTPSSGTPAMAFTGMTSVEGQ